MSGFVIEYHRPTGGRRVTVFQGANGSRDALRRRLELEAARVDRDWEIASLNSESLETLEATHSRYFEGENLRTEFVGDTLIYL